MARRIRLNPCDYFFYGQHKLLTKKSAEGNIAYMILDVEGHIDPSHFRETLARTLAMHPSMMGRLRISFPRGLPYWKTTGDLPAAAQHAASIAHVHQDFRDKADWQDRINQLYPNGEAHRWNHRHGPQVRFEQYSLPDSRTRIFFRWPHFLMDADGAQWFLSQMGRQSSVGKEPAKSISSELLCADDQLIDVFKGDSFWRRVRLVRRGLAAQQAHSGLKIGRLVQTPAKPFARHGVIHRNWTSEETLDVQDAAKREAPSGPALYARYLAACVFRALDRLYKENRVESDAFLITMPVRVGISQHDTRLFEKRPVPGNYLVTPVLCGRRERLDEKRHIGEDILKQLQEYLRSEADLMQWAMMWAASYIHDWSYSMIFKLPLDIGEFALGYSYYGEIKEPVRSLCGARVRNLWGGGPTTTPPALNPVFSKFGDRLNFSLTFDRQVISDEMAARYVELIEDQMFESADLDAEASA